MNTVSVNSDKPNARLVAYAATKGAMQNLTGGLVQLLADKGIRVNCVAPGPVWTPLIPSALAEDAIKNFGKQTPVGRPAQPAELAPRTGCWLPMAPATSLARRWLTGSVPLL